MKSKVDTGLVRPKDNDIFGTKSTYSTHSRVQNEIHLPQTAGTRPPYHDRAAEKLRTLDNVAEVINTEHERNLPKNTDTHYKSDFKRNGFPDHTPQKREEDHPVKIYAPETTPFGAKRFPNSATSNKIIKLT